MKGKIKYWNKEKKYGFIKNEKEEDYFFHETMIKNKYQDEELEEGMKVEFEPTKTDKGQQAHEIKLK